MTSHAIASSLGSAALWGSALALVALVATRRLSPAWQAAIWLLVLARLALIWTPALPFSLADLASREQLEVPLVATGTAVAHAPSLFWPALVAIWLAGAAFVLVRAIVRTPRIRGPVVHDPLFAELRARMGVRATLVVGDALHGPFVAGILNPVVVVPPALMNDRSLLRAALLHELAHVRRRDALGRLVQLIALAAMWWNPIAHVASRRLEAAREAACDAWALDDCQLPPPAYARLLVAMARLRGTAAPMLAAPHALDARIAAVLGPRGRVRLPIVGRVALAALAILVLGGARRASAHNEPCAYTDRLAEQLRQAYPEADLDGDGVLSRDEACELQASLRRASSESSPAQVSELAQFRDEPLGCKADQTAVSPTEPAVCTEEGVDR